MEANILSCFEIWQLTASKLKNIAFASLRMGKITSEQMQRLTSNLMVDIGDDTLDLRDNSHLWKGQ